MNKILHFQIRLQRGAGVFVSSDEPKIPNSEEVYALTYSMRGV